MASRQQQKGTGLGMQYEDLVPKSEWKDQPEATLLTIDLPGFKTDQVKVTYVHTSKMIRVTGERPVSDRRWNRFNEVFTVPQNCLVDKIHGSFKNNVLTITMPKEKITKMPKLPEASKTKTVAAPLEKEEKLEEKRLLEESRKKEILKEDEQKRKKLLEEREGLIRKLQEEAKAKEIAEVNKLVGESIAKEMRKLEEEAKAKKIAEVRKLQEKAEERKLVEEATLEKIKEMKSADESGGKEKILKEEERKLPEVDYTKYGSGFVTKSGSGGANEVLKSGEDKLGYVVEKEKKMEKGIMDKIRGKEITSEEKKLMVNVGVAAIVIFALGAYVSYSFCSSSSSSSSSDMS